MAYSLESFKPLEAACSQYFIDTRKPVRLTLHGPKSYCYLQPISDPSLKAALDNVGVAFERTHHNAFFNFSHTFTPTGKSIDSTNETDMFVGQIFAFVKTAVAAQTNSKLNLNLGDMTKLVVGKAEDRGGFFIDTKRAYNLSVGISQETVERATKEAGLTFENYLTSTPPGTRVFGLGVGQDKIEGLLKGFEDLSI
jgi:hypothetical protein